METNSLSINKGYSVFLKNLKPQNHVNKTNFYLLIVEDVFKHLSYNPPIGLVLRKTKNNIFLEYTLRDMTKSIGITEYCLNESLQENIKTALPTI